MQRPDRSDRSPDRPSIAPRSSWTHVVAALVGALALVWIAAGCSSSGGGSADASSSATIAGIQRPEPLQVGSVTLPEVAPDQPDRPFTFRAPPGGLLFVYFGYTHCPDLCPTTLADLRGALAQLGPDAARVSTAFVTVDPARDTAAVMVPYLGSFVDGAHAIRTEDPAALAQAEGAFLAQSSVAPDGKGGVDVSHTAISYIVDEHGTVLVEWTFGTSPDSMANDLRILLAQTGGGAA